MDVPEDREQVCSTGTGHAEVVHLEYDPGLVSYDELLAVFWNIHDPTRGGRRGHTPSAGGHVRGWLFLDARASVLRD